MAAKKLSPLHMMGREVNLAARSMRSQLDAGLLREGTSFATWIVLQVLSTESGVIQRVLANALEVEGPTLVRRLDQLQKEGLVTRTPSKEDRRATEISLTAKGRALHVRVRAALSEMEKTLLAGLDLKEIETTLKVLRQIIDRGHTG